MPRAPIFLTIAACALGGCQTRNPPAVSAPATTTQAATVASSAPERSEPSDVRQPIVVLHELNPWGSVIGADIPSFTLYDDGSVIYLEEKHRGARIVEGRMSPEQTAQLATRIFDGLKGVPRDVQLSSWTDQPTVRMMARVDGAWRVTYIYGLGTDGKPSTELAHGARPLAPAISQAYLDLRGFTADDGRAWQPERLEVMLGGFEYAKDVVPWPAELPKPPAGLVPDGQHRVRRFQIAASHGDALQRLKISLGQRRAVAWNGHSWSVNVRPVFPGQGEIQKAAL